MIQKNPSRAIQQAVDTISMRLLGEKELYLRTTLGLHFHQHIAVAVRKPRLMPEWLYNRLMRTIVIMEGPLEPGKEG